MLALDWTSRDMRASQICGRTSLRLRGNYRAIWCKLVPTTIGCNRAPELSESHVFFAIFEAHAGYSTIAMAVRRFKNVVVDSLLIGLA
jgi:hypothetical protein